MFDGSFVERLCQHFVVLKSKFQNVVEKLDYYAIETYFKFTCSYEVETKCYQFIKKIYNHNNTGTDVNGEEMFQLNIKEMGDTVIDLLNHEQRSIIELESKSILGQYSSMTARMEFYQEMKKTIELI